MPPPERYALLSVTDRTGIVEFAYDLSKLGYKIIAAGGTAATLRQAEIEVLEAAEFVSSREQLEGRLGLLHPRLLAGISADRDHPGQMHELERRQGVPIDLVAVNFYPLAEVIADRDIPQAEALETVDLAGATLLLAAARNHRHVLPLCDPDDYQPIVDSLKQYGRVLPDRRQTLAAKVFHYAAYYNTTVAQFLGERWSRLPDEMAMGLKKTAEFPYGENPQQQGALYALSGVRPWGVNATQLLYGKSLSYNHFLDLEIAWELATELEGPACVMVKHAVPSGVACSESLAEAARLAYRCDPRGSFRGTAAVNRELGEEAASFFAAEFVSCIAAPQFSQKALDILKTKKDLRLVALPSGLVAGQGLLFRSVAGGVLVQSRDDEKLFGETRVATRRAPNELEMISLRVGWQVAKHARTHAAVLCQGPATIGIGSGQTSRLDAVRLAIVKSQERHPIVRAGQPLVIAADGSLSAEHLQEAAMAGVTAVIQAGGTSEDRDAVAYCDSKGLAMLFAGVRHFRH